MKFAAVAVALVSVVPAALGQATLQVNTVTGITQCQPIKFTWTGGQGPYFLSLIPAAQPAAPAVKQFPTQTGTEYTWIADLPGGTTFTISLKDSQGTQAYSDIETINNGPDSSCLNTAVTEGGSSSSDAGSSATTAAPASGTTAAATNPSASAGSSAATSASHSGSGSASSSPSKTSSGAAASQTSNAAGKGSSISAFGVAGVMGLLGAALF